MSSFSSLFYCSTVFAFLGFISCNSFVSKFEFLSYPLDASRQKRESHVSISFRSHHRRYHLRLKRDTRSAFGKNHVLDENGDHISSIGPDFFYEGHLEDDANSYVYGSLIDGQFDGHIHTGDGKLYHVEKADKYYSPQELIKKHGSSKFHSIIYEDSAINYKEFSDQMRNRREKRETKDEKGNVVRGSCGLDKKHEEQLRELQNSAIDNEFMEDYKEKTKERYSQEMNSFREKRQTGKINSIGGHKLYNVRTCSLYMQADQKLYNQIYNREGQKSHTRTREEILSLFNNHIKAVNHIYGETSFGGVNHVNFVIQRTSIYNDSSCSKGNSKLYRSNPVNPFCQDNVDVSNYLNLNSKRNHSNFCLAYAVTYRDFVGGTLGLAWVASPAQVTAGGVCEVYKEYSERQGRVMRSLNTGIVTLVNYGNRVPPRVSQLTLAHEIGHNFGSPHDYPSYCQPGLPDGNYIMFASATSGDKRNNAKFSECSVKNISNVLYAVLSQMPVDPQKQLRSPSGGKRNCFTESSGPFCGNQIREEGEQCDCGFTQEDCDSYGDACCYPHQTTEIGATGCTLRQIPKNGLPQNVKCSPSQGACCDARTCQYKSQSDRCRESDDCTEQQFCSRFGPQCSPSPPKPDNTVCQENTRICVSGNCNRSICEMIGYQECFITGGSPEDQCQLACKRTPTSECQSSFEVPALKKFYQTSTGSKGILLRPGSPCNNYKGYCDIFRKCRSVDSNGPLSRLKNLLFNEKTIQTVLEWIQVYWWAVVLMGVALVLFMALFIKCCAVHTPSTNPRKPPAHSIYETLRRPSSLIHPRHRTRREQSGERDRHRRQGGRSRSRDQPRPLDDLNGAQPSAPPEQPPPYSAAVARDPAVYGGNSGPPRGHRKPRTNRSNQPTRT